MPARSKAQQEVMAIAEHDPGKLHARNRGLLKMSQSQLHDFAATKRTRLPTYVKHGSAGGSHYTGYQREWTIGPGRKMSDV
jgi:hypothetical protein